MNAYMFNAALWCENCIVGALPTGPGQAYDGWKLADGVKMDTESNLNEVAAAFGIDRKNESSFDSDEFPKGPYADGGGEADTAQHCDGCHCHLENPLTSHGAEHIAKALLDGDGDPDVLDTWAEFYGSDLDIGNDEMIDALKSACDDAAGALENELTGGTGDGSEVQKLIRHLRRLQKL